MSRANILEDAANYRYFIADNPDLRNDKEVVLINVSNYPGSYQYASIDLQTDEDVINAWKININEWRKPILERYLNLDNRYFNHSLFVDYPQLCDDKETIVKMVIRFSDAYKWASDNLQSDDDVIYTIIENWDFWDNFSFNFPFYDHKKFMLGIVRLYPEYFCYASSQLKADKDFISLAVTNNGLLLEMASDELKSDEEVVTIAVANNRNAIDYASQELKSGGLKAYLMEYQQSKIAFLCGCMPKIANNSPLFKLNLHGPHFAKLFKKKILGFSEDPFDEYVIKAIQNIK